MTHPDSTDPGCTPLSAPAPEAATARLLQLESVLRKLPDAIVITEALFTPGTMPRIIYVNDAFCRITGYDRTEVIGHPPTFLHGADTSPDVTQAISRALSDHKPIRTEVRNYRKDGSLLIFDLDISPITDPSGAVTHWISIQRDITYERRIETALQETLTRFHEMADLLPIALCEVDLDLKALYVNQPGLDMFCGSQKNLDQGIRIIDLIHPNDRDRAIATCRDILRGTGRNPNEYRVRRLDGTEFWALTHSVPIIRDGQVVGMRSCLTDITQLKQTQNSLLTTREELTSILENIPSAIVIKHIESFTVMTMNRAALSLLTASPYLAENRSDFDLFPPEIARSIRMADEAAVRSFHTQELPEVCVTLDGLGERILRFKEIPIPDPDGGLRCLLSIIDDLTDQKRAEQEVRQMELQIRHTQKLESLGVLAGGIAHDFNNLLTGILGYSSLLSADSANSPKTQRAVDQIVKAAERAADLCNQILAYAGKAYVDIHSLDLNEIIEDMHALLDVSLSSKAHIHLELDPAIPAIRADGTQIRQVILNLVTNAAEACQETHGTVTVRTGLTHCSRDDLRSAYIDDNLPEGSYVCLEIIDTGCGMTPETIGRIFDPFFSTKFLGRGLGLSVVLGIIRAHRGTLTVESHPGNGSHFRVFLPIAIGAPEPSDPDARQDDAPMESGTILVADEETTVSVVTAQILESAGFQTICAHDGTSLLRQLSASGPSIRAIVLDVSILDRSGNSLFDLIYGLQPDVPIVMSSGYMREDVLKRYQPGGVFGFIQKPYRAIRLLDAVRAVLYPV